MEESSFIKLLKEELPKLDPVAAERWKKQLLGEKEKGGNANGVH
jgi:hypothetical protein